MGNIIYKIYDNVVYGLSDTEFAGVYDGKPGAGGELSHGGAHTYVWHPAEHTGPG